MRRYVNYFQPSFKPIDKIRNGSTVVKRYSPPATPCDQLLRQETISDDAKAMLGEHRAALDPVALLHTIREAQSALTALTAPDSGPRPKARAWSSFWPVRPTSGVGMKRILHGGARGRKVAAPRTWRTREDPFAGVWCDVLGWLQEEPDASAVALLAGCSPPIPTATAGRTCERCSGGCNSGEASWRTSWSMQRLKQRCRNSTECRKWH